MSYWYVFISQWVRAHFSYKYFVSQQRIENKSKWKKGASKKHDSQAATAAATSCTLWINVFAYVCVRWSAFLIEYRIPNRREPFESIAVCASICKCEYSFYQSEPTPIRLHRKMKESLFSYQTTLIHVQHVRDVPLCELSFTWWFRYLPEKIN